jgi:hypothetical protein
VLVRGATGRHRKMTPFDSFDKNYYCPCEACEKHER